MRTFENPTEIYIPIFERDTKDWLQAGGVFSPEVYVERATKESAKEFIDGKAGDLGNACIAKLKLCDSVDDWPEGPMFIITESDGIEDKPIVCERVGNNTNHILNHHFNGMKCRQGRVKFMVIDSIEKVEL